MTTEKNTTEKPNLFDSVFNMYSNMYNKEIVDDVTNEDEDPEILKNNMLREYSFELPIEYHKHYKLKDVVKKDLEMNEDSKNNIISNILPSSQNHNQLLLNKLSTLYTNNKKFLKDNQKLLKSYNSKETKMDSFVSEYLDFKHEQNFLSKYQYIQFRRLFFLNSIVIFLQFLALYNISTPLFSLLAPIIGLIIPYFIFYFRGVKMSFQDYYKLIKVMIMNSSIVKNFTTLRKGNAKQKLYVLVYIFFYGIGIYNNVNSCIQFYNNTNYMIDFNEKYCSFLDQGESLINHVHQNIKSYSNFKDFNNTMMEHKKQINKMKETIKTLNMCTTKYAKCSQIGLLLKYNFDIYYDSDYHNTIMYLIYLNQYHKNIMDISNLVKNQKLNICKYTKKKSTKMVNMYYLPHINESCIGNDIKLNKNIMITGPNASGKTTVIKSSIINIFLSQSLGVGCYNKCLLNPYQHFHSYLNIPDTSNRDSLFQAEARRCKDIFSYIKKNDKERHLCIFDEIYSGTNPEDAVLCATVYLNGINQYKKNVDYVLTTHYLELCKSFNKDKCVKTQQMSVKENDDNTIEYSYKLKDGISEVHGGYQVLKKLEYPDELLKKKTDS